MSDDILKSPLSFQVTFLYYDPVVSGSVGAGSDIGGAVDGSVAGVVVDVVVAVLLVVELASCADVGPKIEVHNVTQCNLEYA